MSVRSTKINQDVSSTLSIKMFPQNSRTIIIQDCMGKRLIYQSESNWAKLVLVHLLPGGDTIFMGNISQKDIFRNKLLPKSAFWKDVLLAWVKLNYMENTTMDKIDQQPIWYNSKIQIQDKVIFYKTWVDDAGMHCIKRLTDDRGIMLTYDQFCAKYQVNINIMQF